MRNGGNGGRKIRTDADVRYISLMALAAIEEKGAKWAPAKVIFDHEEKNILNNGKTGGI